MAKKKATARRPGQADEAKAAYERLEAAMQALDERELVPINVDIPLVVAQVLGVESGIRALRPQIGELPDFDLRNIDELRQRALATWYAHLSEAPIKKERTVQSLVEAATPLRAGLLVAAEALAHRGLFDAERVAEIRSGSGHVDTANDLVALAAMFDELWDTIATKTAVERDEVERAALLGPELLVALGTRDAAPAAPAARMRQRAFTLLVRAYRECRRALTYLRWHDGDADELAPSLFRKRGPRKSPDEPADTDARDAEPAVAGA